MKNLLKNNKVLIGEAHDILELFIYFVGFESDGLTNKGSQISPQSKM